MVLKMIKTKTKQETNTKEIAEVESSALEMHTIS